MFYLDQQIAKHSSSLSGETSLDVIHIAYDDNHATLISKWKLTTVSALVPEYRRVNVKGRSMPVSCVHTLLSQFLSKSNDVNLY